MLRIKYRLNLQDERERVNEMGGAVMHWGIWRVNGQLAVSRAIGGFTIIHFWCLNSLMTKCEAIVRNKRRY